MAGTQVIIDDETAKGIQVVCPHCASKYLIVMQKAATVELLKFCIVCGKRAVFYNAEENRQP